MNKEDFQKVLQLLRMICEVSTSEISAELGIPEEKYNLWENGKLLPTEAELEKIAAFYNATVDGLLDKDINNFYIQTYSVSDDKIYILNFTEKLLLLLFRRLNLMLQDKALDLVMQCYFESDEDCHCENTGIVFNLKGDCATTLVNNEPSLINAFRKIPDKNKIFSFLTQANECIESDY